MSKYNLPRVPVHLNSEHNDLRKAQLGNDLGQDKEGTNYVNDVTVMTVQGNQATYRTPEGRSSGNVFFRRYMDGTLDIEHASHRVIECLHALKDSGNSPSQLNNEEKTILNALFPMQFSFIDAAVLRQIILVQLRLSPQEVEAVRTRVATHMAEELNYNAGRGGGSVPGRHQTRS